jgi:hypothetical protein
MMKSGKVDVVEDTEENREICRKYCKICPNYKRHSLEKYQPVELFCACGMSSSHPKKELGCYCVGCELFAKYKQRLGYFCSQH